MGRGMFGRKLIGMFEFLMMLRVLGWCHMRCLILRGVLGD